LTLASTEYRFPLFKSLGGVLCVDAGKLYQHLREIDLHQWRANWGCGLRYSVANFVTRLDVGISDEGTRIFFNFGHVF
jgi:outer membrane protein assembly factor BamA